MIVDNRWSGTTQQNCRKENRLARLRKFAGIRWQDRGRLDTLWKSKADRIADAVMSKELKEGMESIKPEDMVGDAPQGKCVTITSCNSNNGVLYTVGSQVKKETSSTWSDKYKRWCRYMLMNKTDILLVQEAGLASKKGVMERVAKLHGYSARINARIRGNKVKATGAGEGMIVQMESKYANMCPVYIEDSNARLQVCIMMGGTDETGRQRGLAIINVYVPSQDESKMSRRTERDEYIIMLNEIITKLKGQGYHILLMGDVNTAMRDKDRCGGLRREDVRTMGMMEWGLKDIWVEREKCWSNINNDVRRAHTWFKCYGETVESSRIDYALCDPEFLERFVKGIRVDKVARMPGVDHRPLTVDIAKEFWKQDKGKEVEEWKEDEEGPRIDKRISFKGWSKADIETYKQELEELYYSKERKDRDGSEWVYAARIKKPLRKMSYGQPWGQWYKCTRDPTVALTWASGQKSKRKGKEVYKKIIAVSLEELRKDGVEVVDLSSREANVKRCTFNKFVEGNIEQKIVAVRGSIVGRHVSPQLEPEGVQEWVGSLLVPDLGREEDIQKRLDVMYNKLVVTIQGAAEKVKPKVVVEKNGRNTRAYWNSVITCVQRERQLVTGMLQAYGRWQKYGREEDWMIVEERSMEWCLEWRTAKGEFSQGIVRKRSRVKLPTVSLQDKLKWRNMEARKAAEPLVMLEEVTEPLMVPLDSKDLRGWVDKLKGRRNQLKRVTSAEYRAVLFEEGEMRKKWDDDYVDGKVKGLVSRIMDKMNGAHSIDNVWLSQESGLRLSCDPHEIRGETERFFREWFRARALPLDEQPPTHPNVDQYAKVKQRVEKLLDRVNLPGNKWRDLHANVDEEVSIEELEEYLAKVKKGTAPGLTGIPAELWMHAIDEVLSDLVIIMNLCLRHGKVPSKWRYRLIRPIAKTDSAIGLSDIRPITLCEVAQKLVTGILTERIAGVWNNNSILHLHQMAFLSGRCCYHAIERVRGLLLDVERKNVEGEPTELHMLYLDLAKAYDSVEFWALEDAMRGLGVPDKVVTLMSALDNEAYAKVLMGGVAKESGWIKLGRGAAQGEVMSPLRFIAWINLLLEVLEEEGVGYKVTTEQGETVYSGQAFCDDGFFVAESNEDLQKIGSIVSAFCEIFKVKINANKCDYQVSRGVSKNGEVCKEWDTFQGVETLQLWDHTASNGDGEWLEVKERKPSEAIRYLGVMISATRDGRAQRTKVDKAVMKIIDKVRGTRCSMGLAEYIIRACIGGILNYHAPFTNITNSMLLQWDARIRAVLREKGGIKAQTRLGALYDKDGMGLGWYSARSGVREVVLTEGWIALTSDTLEGEMLRIQWRDRNHDRGTIYSPLAHPVGEATEKLRWQSCIRMMEDSLLDIKWSIVSDVPRWGKDGVPAGRQEFDRSLSQVRPDLTQLRIGGSSLVQDAQRWGVHWTSQLFDEETGEFKECDDSSRQMRTRWKAVLELGGPIDRWNPFAMPRGERCEKLSLVPDTLGRGGDRRDEYEMSGGLPLLVNGSRNIVMVSDGSLRDGRAAYATGAVQNVEGSSCGRVKGTQRVSKSELIGAWAQMKIVAPYLNRHAMCHFHGWLDNQGICKSLQRAGSMSDRQIKRNPEPGLYWRQMREWARMYEGRVHWHWMKGHTRRIGPLHMAHNKCDELAGIKTLDEEQDPAMFVHMDWQMVFVNEVGVRVEGDPRTKIRRRVSALFWQEGSKSGSVTDSHYENMDEVAKGRFRKVMLSKGSHRAKKEMLEAIRGKWGLMFNSDYEDESCRLCEPCVFCKPIAEEVWDEGCPMCHETIHHAVHNRCTQELSRLYEGNMSALQDKVCQLVRWVHIDRLEAVVETEDIWRAVSDYVKIIESVSSEEDCGKDPWKAIGENESMFIIDNGDGVEINIGEVDCSHEVGRYPKGTTHREHTTRLKWHDGQFSGAVERWTVYNVMRSCVMRGMDDPMEIAEVVWDIVPKVHEDVGPVTRTMVDMLCAATRYTANETMVWDHPTLWSQNGRQGASTQLWRRIGIEEREGDVNRIRVRWGAIGKNDIMEMDIRAEERGLECFDIYILPEGVVTSKSKHPFVGVQWVKLGVTEAGTLWQGDKRVDIQGEVWFTGGHCAWRTIDWAELRKGCGIDWEAQLEVVQAEARQPYLEISRELLGCGHRMLKLKGEADARTRWEGASELVSRCRLAQWPDVTNTVMKLLEAGQDMIWNMKNGFKQEVYAQREEDAISSEDEEEVGKVNVLTRMGEDKSRVGWKLPVAKDRSVVVATAGRKLKVKYLTSMRNTISKDSILGLPEAAIEGKSNVGVVLERKAQMWARLISCPIEHIVRKKGRVTGVQCKLCPATACRYYGGLYLCASCHNKAPTPAEGWLIEGLTWMCEAVVSLVGIRECRKLLTSRKAAMRWKKWLVDTGVVPEEEAMVKWYEGMCYAMGCTKLLPSEWEQVWVEMEEVLQELMRTYWQPEYVTLSRPQHVVHWMNSGRVWVHYSRFKIEERREALEKLVQERARRQAAAELQKVNMLRKREEVKAARVRELEEKKARAEAKVQEKRWVAVRRQEEKDRERELRKVARQEIKALAREHKLQLRIQKKKEKEAMAQVRMQEQTKQRAAEAVAKAQEEAAKHKRQAATHRPTGGKSSSVEKASEGWLHKLTTGTGRMSKWVHDLSEWTKVETVARQGKGSYVLAAIRKGHIVWHARRPGGLDVREQSSAVEPARKEGASPRHAVNVQVPLQVTGAQQAKRLGSSRKRPQRQRSGQQLANPDNQWEHSQSANRAQRSDSQSETLASRARRQCSGEDYHHRNGWP